MERTAYLERARNRGVNPIVYWLVRAVLQPFFHIYFRLSRIGREHIPSEGPVIFAANHRSFLDPFVIGTMMRRPIYYVAKKELFRQRVSAWFLNSLGAFPIDRGAADKDAMDTAREILERGDCVLIFPEGTRIRPGGLGTPKRGVGRLALETGAPVVPVAVIGTERIRRGWRIRPHKVRIRAGAPLRFPKVDEPSKELASAVTERIWPCVALQWEWLGGMAPLRRAAVIGAGEEVRGLAAALDRAGLEVGGVDAVESADLVCLAGPTGPSLLARVPASAGVLVTEPARATHVAEHSSAWAVAALDGDRLTGADRAFLTQLEQVFAAAGERRDVTTSGRVVAA